MGVIRVAVLVGLMVGGSAWAEDIPPSDRDAKSAWQNLRWGMSSKETMSKLSQIATGVVTAPPQEHAVHEGMIESWVRGKLREKIADCEVEVSATLLDDRLDMIHLHVGSCSGKDPESNENTRLAFVAMRRLLGSRYGTPKRDTSVLDGAARDVTWERDGTSIGLTMVVRSPQTRHALGVSITYSDSVAGMRRAKALLEKSRLRIEAEAQKL